MNKLKKASAVAGLVLVLVACNPIKFISKKVEQIMVVATPQYLEVHGKEVSYSLKGKFPPKVFHRKAYVTLTPILEYDGGSIKLDPVKYRGEKTEGEGKVINFKEGGSFTCEGSFDFKDEMAGKNAVLKLEIEVCKDAENCKSFTKEDLAWGVITTSRLIADDDRVFFAGFGKDDNGSENAKSISDAKRTFKRTIFFELNRWNVRTSEKRSDRVKEMLSFVQTPRLELKGISVNSYASPDGELKLNQDLTDKRSNSTYKFLAAELKALKVSTGTEDMYKRQAMEEDWVGLKSLVSASNLPDKSEALQIINSSQSNDDKEAALRKLASWDKMLEDIMPQLRRSDVALQGVVKNRSLEELKKLAGASYDDFTSNELLIYAAGVSDLDQKIKTYEAFVKAKPASIIGYNNLASCYILKGELNKAQSQLDKAKQMAGDNDTLYNNYGVIYRRQGDLEKATASYQRAQKAGIGVGYNMAIIHVINGDYSSASTSIPANACGGNAALVAILSGNPADGNAKISCDKDKSALDYYIAAIASARQKDVEYMAVNLKSAVEMDKSYAEKATNDLEFHSYWESAEFKNAVNR